MMVLGLDSSTRNLGFAIGDKSFLYPRGGVYKLPGAKDEFLLAETMAGALNGMISLIHAFKPDRVFIEAPIQAGFAGRSAHTDMVLALLTGAIMGQFAIAKIPCRPVSSGTVRKFFIHNGRPKGNPKIPVMKRCDELGWTYKDDNEADAKAVWAFGMSVAHPGWTPDSKGLFDK